MVNRRDLIVADNAIAHSVPLISCLGGEALRIVEFYFKHGVQVTSYRVEVELFCWAIEQGTIGIVKLWGGGARSLAWISL